MISDEDIQKVRAANDIVELFSERVPVRQRGRQFWCCCPFHDEKTPSCKIDAERQNWHCFGCHEGGDIFTLVMKLEDLDFIEAVRYLADRAHVEIDEQGSRGPSRNEKARLRSLCAETARFYHRVLMRNPESPAQAARDYLSSRDLGGAIPKIWQLGYAPGRQQLVSHLRSLGYKDQEMIDANVAMSGAQGLRDRFFNRVIFPIADPSGEVIAFGGRVIGTGEPKYLNSQDTPLFHKSQVLYGLDKAKDAITAKGDAVVVEGYTDVIALHEAGVTNAVATLGTALTAQHIRLLSRYVSHRIIYLFDGDEAGQRAADRALEFIDSSQTPESGRRRVELAAVTLPDKLDPADFVATRDGEALAAALDGAKPLIQFGIERRLKRYDLSSPEQRSEAAMAALSLLAPIKDSILAKDYAVQIAAACRMRESDALERLEKLTPPRRFAEGPQPTPSASDAAAELNAQETNRLRIERELLSFVVQNPRLALDQSQALASLSWHSSLHQMVAEALLDQLGEDPAISSSELLSRISRALPQAGGLLTSGSLPLDEGGAHLVQFLVNELRIGDEEDTVAALKAQLKQGVSSEEESRFLFESIAAIQHQIQEVKRRQRELPS